MKNIGDMDQIAAWKVAELERERDNYRALYKRECKDRRIDCENIDHLIAGKYTAERERDELRAKLASVLKLEP